MQWEKANSGDLHTDTLMPSAEYSETHSQEKTINSGARAAEKEQGEQTSETPQGWK